MSDRRITETMPVELLRHAHIYEVGSTEPHDLEALAWSCGIDTEETYILVAPAANHSARFAQDRAAVVTTAVLQIVCEVIAGARDAIASLLRDEFADMARQIVADRGDKHEGPLSPGAALDSRMHD